MLTSPVVSALALYPAYGGKRVNITLPHFSIPQDEKHQPIKELVRALRQIEHAVIDAIIFSSVATKEIVRHWSDADILIVLRDEILADAQTIARVRSVLLSLEKYLYEFDPWQHHGIQYMTASDLHFYPESFLPIVTLEKAASLLHAPSLTIHVRDSHREREQYFMNVCRTLADAAARGELRHHDRDGVYLKNNYANREQSFYQFKYFISVVLLLPSLYLGLEDKPVAKKDSFVLIREHSSEQELEFLTACERVRLLFTTLRPRRNEIPKEVQTVLGTNYFERASAFATMLLERYERQKSAAS